MDVAVFANRKYGKENLATTKRNREDGTFMNGLFKQELHLVFNLVIYLQHERMVPLIRDRVLLLCSFWRRGERPSEAPP